MVEKKKIKNLIYVIRCFVYVYDKNVNVSENDRVKCRNYGE
jgi:hypothetical protein